MGDFYQNGIITTLHNLSNRSVEVMMSIAVLIGALMMIYVLLFGGQLTGPIGL